MKTRLAEPADLAAMTEIYNQAIRAGQQTADTTPMSPEARRPWLDSHSPGKYPVLVADDDGLVVGYLSLSPYRPGRMALRHTAEVSYYVHHDHFRRGIGSRLMEQAIEICPALDIRTLIAILMESNRASVALLESFGFARWGHLPGVAEFDGVEVGQFYYGLRLPG